MKIGLKNFRRFEKLEPIEFGGVTFLVGRNNSGKSTITSALSLLINFIRSRNQFEFSFNHSKNDINRISNFNRTKTLNSKDDFVEINFEVKNFICSLIIINNEKKSNGLIYSYKIHDTINNINFEFNLLNKNLHIFRKSKSTNQLKEDDDLLIALNEKKDKLKGLKSLFKNYEFQKTSAEYIDLLTEKENLSKQVKEINKSIRNRLLVDSSAFEFDYNYEFTGDLQTIVWSFGRKLEKDNENHKNLKFINMAMNTIRKFIIETSPLKYSFISQVNPKQGFMVNVRDESNNLSEVLDTFYNSNILPGEGEHLFLQKWLNEFSIGQDYIVEKVNEEAFVVKIIQDNKLVYLNELGSGSLQLVSFLFSIANRIKEINRLIEINSEFQDLVDEYDRNPLNILLFEEPELYMHPASQSKLADLFHELFVKYNFKLIVETHSEYLIRKTQLIVKEKEYEVKPNVNPFKVIYIDNNKEPWEMEYRPDGVFKNSFGTGFFDVSSQQAISLIRK